MKTLTTALMTLALCSGLTACDPHGTTVPTIDDGVAMGAASSAHDPTKPSTTNESDAGAPAPDASASPTGAALFLGKWTYVSGTMTISCDGQGDDAEDERGTLTFTDGDSPDEVIASDGNGCDVPCKVSGDVATSEGGQTCPGDVAVASLVYTLKDGMLREQAGGNVSVDSHLCTFSGDATLSHR